MNIKYQILALLAVGILFSFSNAYAQQRNQESNTEIGNEQFTPSTLIISYGERKDTTALYKAVKKYGASFIYKYNNFNAIAISIPKEKNIGDAIIYFKKIKGVLSVVRDRIYHLDEVSSAQ